MSKKNNNKTHKRETTVDSADICTRTQQQCKMIQEAREKKTQNTTLQSRKKY